MKTHTRVVVIGGGAVGVSTLYHLTKKGWSDVALVERSELTAAGTPATATGAGSDPEALTTRFCEELEALAGVAYRVRDVHAADDQDVSIVARTEAQSVQPGQPRPRGQTRQILGWNIEDRMMSM